MVTTYHVIGVMSGTSLDGMDIAFCRFTLNDGKWTYEIPHATTLKYNDAWAVRLMMANSLSARNLAKMDADFGHLIGKNVKRFMRKHGISADLIASHGQTIMHEPQNGFTVQIGSGAAIAAETGMTVVCDLRSADVALGGQGAPLVPIGDRLLFGEYGACLNIGGFANISYNKARRRVAYDICPANVVLNYMARKIGKKYDAEGRFASKGQVIEEFLNALNELGFYSVSPPKSLGIEWIKHIDALLDKYKTAGLHDQMRTLTEHIAMQIAYAIKNSGAKTTLATGGGTHNAFLISRIEAHCGQKPLVPAREIIDYKEALIFGLLGVLRLRGEANCLSSATGARRDCCGGAVYLGS